MEPNPTMLATGTPGNLVRLIRSGEATTRAELALTTGLARSTIAQRIDSLTAHGWIKDTGEAPSTGGRPPTVLGFNPHARTTLVADIGATHSRVALTNLGGAIIAEATADIDISSGPEEVLGWVERSFRGLQTSADGQIGELAGIGIGLPLRVKFAEGRSVSPPITPGWDGYAVREHFAERFGVPVLVDNDVNIMALGESWAMDFEVSDLLFVKVGTGIGSGLILGGRIHRGALGMAGDLGHVPVPESDAACSCGNVGCLEMVAGGAALARQLAAVGKGTVDSRDVTDLVRRGDPVAGHAVREAGRVIGRVLADAVTLLNPALIVVGGDIAEGGDQLLAGVREEVFRRSTARSTNGLVIAPSAVGDHAGVVGAAAMVIEHVLDPASIDASLDGRGHH